MAMWKSMLLMQAQGFCYMSVFWVALRKCIRLRDRWSHVANFERGDKIGRLSARTLSSNHLKIEAFSYTRLQNRLPLFSAPLNFLPITRDW